MIHRFCPIDHWKIWRRESFNATKQKWSFVRFSRASHHLSAYPRWGPTALRVRQALFLCVIRSSLMPSTAMNALRATVYTHIVQEARSCLDATLLGHLVTAELPIEKPPI